MFAQNLTNTDSYPLNKHKITLTNHHAYNHNHNRASVFAALNRFLPQRNAVIDWIYRAQKILGFSRSTLFLAIALLDKLISFDLPPTDSNFQTVAGTLLLLATKFNEVYPITVRKLQALSCQLITLDKYVEAESLFLQALNFNLSPSDTIYQNLAKLESTLGEQSEETIKTALTNPAVAFRMGSTALLTAIQSIASGGLIERINDSRLSRESAELRMELQRLRSRSPNHKRMVSPQRA